MARRTTVARPITVTVRTTRKGAEALRLEIQRLARKNFKLWLRDPAHPSLHFKKVGSFWSARIGRHHRALAVWEEDTVEWFWIGSHNEYESLL